MRHVVLIDYGSGNLRSATKAFERVCEGTDTQVTVTDDAARLNDATHIVLPGVGAFADCMRGLNAAPRMRETLESRVQGDGVPFLGICVGMQMLFAAGYEHGAHAGLGWLEGEVVSIPAAPTRKIPHMGWNDLILEQPEHPLLSGITTGDHAYFVHSYHAVCASDLRLASVDYGLPLTAVVAKGNVMGAQFHPEKSQATGLRLLSNFLGLSAAR